LVGVAAWIGAAVFGAAGALARFRVDSAVSARFPGSFPLGTFVVNLSGSFLLGAFVGLSLPHRVMFILGTGFTGGYTTFSTWMVESARLGEVEELPLLLANLGLSMLLGLGMAAAGFYAGQAIA
jgi:fluoride exporter